MDALLQSNPYLRQQRGFRRTILDGSQALNTRLVGRSNVTGRTEVVTVYTTMLRNGNLFYLSGVTPQDQSWVYNRALRSNDAAIAQSQRLENQARALCEMKPNESRRR